MSYRNPKAAPINTGAAVYKGIQKLSSDVVTFANNERARKAALIAQGLVFSQEIDDNVNKMGSLTLEKVDSLVFKPKVLERRQRSKRPNEWPICCTGPNLFFTRR